MVLVEINRKLTEFLIVLNIVLVKDEMKTKKGGI